MTTLPKSGFRTEEYSKEQIRWRCQKGTCGYTSETRDAGHEYTCGSEMVPVSPYGDVPIRYEDLTVFERMELEGQ